MSAAEAPTDTETPTDDLMSEYVQLNSRRLFGAPPLGVAGLERWQELHEVLETRLGGKLQGLIAAVERRAHLRFTTHLEVRFESGDELRSACLGNISEGGIFIATERPLAPETALRLSICAPEGLVGLVGRVAWRRDVASEAGPAGMGVRFEDMSDEQRDEIAKVVVLYEPKPDPS